jgi:cytochrome P450
MTPNRYRYAVRTMSFLGSLAGEPAGMVELRGEAPRRLLVWDPDTIGRIFRAERQMWMASSRTLTPLVGDRSLLYLNGARHSAYRKVVGNALRGRRLSAYHDTIADTAHAAVEEMLAAGRVRLPDWTRRLTLGIVGRVLLGTGDRELLEPFTGWVESVLKSRPRTLTYRYLRLHQALPSPWRTFLRRRAELADALLDAARGGGGGGRPATLAADLLSGAEPLGAVDDEELQDQIISLLFAGHETTASAIAWTLYWLERNPAIRRELRDHLAATTADGSDAEEVPLLDAACKEALRISPPAMVAGHRVLSEDMDLLDQRMPTGTRLTPSIYLVHRRPDIYPDPHRFDPGRFVGVRRSAQEYLPFGGGMRRCLGADLALVELRMVVAAVLRRSELHCVNPRAGVPHLRGPAMGPGPDLTMEVRAWRP